MLSAALKLLELQAKLQLQFEQLKSNRLAKIIILHGVTIHSREAVALPQFSLGSLCKTIEQFKKFPSACIYLEIPRNRDGVIPTTFPEQVSMIKEKIKMACIAGGGVLV